MFNSNYIKGEKNMRYTILCIVAFTLLLQGCRKKGGEKIAEKLIESAAAKDGMKADVKISDGKITIKTDKGQTTYAAGKDTKLPDNFPHDVYVYSDANIVAAMTVPEGFSIVMETKDNQDKVFNTMKSKFTERGWKEEMIMVQGENRLLTYRKDKKTVNIIVAGEKKGTQISMIVAMENDGLKE